MAIKRITEYLKNSEAITDAREHVCICTCIERRWVDDRTLAPVGTELLKLHSS